MGTVLAFYEGEKMMPSLFGEIEALGPWTAHIQAMDQAVAEDAPGESVRAWRQAYSAALSHPGWLGLLAVAAASLRLGVFPGLARGAVARARDLLDGVLPRAPAALAHWRPPRGRSVQRARRSGHGRAMPAGGRGSRDPERRCGRRGSRAADCVPPLRAGAGRGAQRRALDEKGPSRQDVAGRRRAISTCRRVLLARADLPSSARPSAG